MCGQQTSSWKKQTFFHTKLKFNLNLEAETITVSLPNFQNKAGVLASSMTLVEAANDPLAHVVLYKNAIRKELKKIIKNQLF